MSVPKAVLLVGCLREVYPECPHGANRLAAAPGCNRLVPPDGEVGHSAHKKDARLKKEGGNLLRGIPGRQCIIIGPSRIPSSGISVYQDAHPSPPRKTGCTISLFPIGCQLVNPAFSTYYMLSTVMSATDLSAAGAGRRRDADRRPPDRPFDPTSPLRVWKRLNDEL